MAASKNSTGTPKNSVSVSTNDRTAEIIRIRSAVAWRPAPGDTVEGTVVKLLRRDGAGDLGPYPVIVMDTGAPHYTAVHAFHTLCRDALKELKTAPGDEVTIAYLGKVESKNMGADGKKRYYHNYIVIGNGVDSTVEFSWDNDETDDPDF